MKKDFSQPFDKKPTTYYILAENSSGDFLMLPMHDEEYDDKFFELPTLILDDSREVPQKLAKLLYSYGFLLESFRYMASATRVSFSFVDDAHGTERQNACIYAHATRTNHIPENKLKTNFLSLPRLIEELGGAPTDVLGPALIELMLEKKRPYNYRALDRRELIRYIIESVQYIRQFTVDELCEAGDYSDPDARYPQSVSEKFVDNLLKTMHLQNWIEPDKEPLLYEIESLLQELDHGVNKQNIWEKLLQKVDELASDKAYRAYMSL